MYLITFDYFLIAFLNFSQKFSAVNHFQIYKPGSVNGRRGAANLNKRPIKSIRTASDFTKRP